MAPLHAYLNGAWVEDRGLSIPIADPGFAMGVTITERLRTFDGRVWRQWDHRRRLARSAEIVGIDLAAVDEIDAAISEFVTRHEPLRLAAAVDGQPADWAIVAFATPGRGGEPTRCVHGFLLPFGNWADQYRRGVALRTSRHRQTPAECWPTELKCRSRMHYYLADREAAAAEPGTRALLLDGDGFVGEASTANVLAWFGETRQIVSPRLEKVLPGVSVLSVADLAPSLGAEFVQRDLAPEEFAAADEVWLASTSVCLLPVVRLDGAPIGDGTPGPAFTEALGAWNA
ncbi:MAG: aminotransferase class IV, partial [Planctomycetota bacterium]